MHKVATIEAKKIRWLSTNKEWGDKIFIIWKKLKNENTETEWMLDVSKMKSKGLVDDSSNKE